MDWGCDGSGGPPRCTATPPTRPHMFPCFNRVIRTTRSIQEPRDIDFGLSSVQSLHTCESTKAWIGAVRSAKVLLESEIESRYLR